ncbi:MAG: hypothetical protein WBG62_15655 [Cyclobacteriaceae bacterium]
MIFIISSIRLLSGNAEYVYVTFFVLFVISVSLIMINSLYKKVIISNNEIIISTLLGTKYRISKTAIKGYYHYTTFSVLGDENSLYLVLDDGHKVGIHEKAYKNFKEIKRAIGELGLKSMKNYSYKNTFLKHIRKGVVISFFISVILFLIVRIFIF